MYIIDPGDVWYITNIHIDVLKLVLKAAPDLRTTFHI